VAAQVGGETAARLIGAADHAFVDAMSTATGIGGAVALLGAAIALAFLPSRGRPNATRADIDQLEVAMA
jgi:hypothetical protein